MKPNWFTDNQAISSLSPVGRVGAHQVWDFLSGLRIQGAWRSLPSASGTRPTERDTARHTVEVKGLHGLHRAMGGCCHLGGPV